MPKIHRMSSAENRVWRENTPQLVDTGEPGKSTEWRVVRAITLKEEEHVARLLAQAKKAHKSVSSKVSGPDGEPVEITVTHQRALNGETYLVTLDGYSRKTSREVITHRLLRQYDSDVQLRRPSGIVAGVLRDPARERPAAADANRTAPKPEYCACKDWGNPHPGRHHLACPHNVNAPPGEKASGEVDDGGIIVNEDPKEGEIVAVSNSDAFARPVGDVPAFTLPVPGPISTMSAESEQMSGVNLDDLSASNAALERRPNTAENVENGPGPIAPKDCQCLKWARPPGTALDKHHPLCEHRAAWEMSQNPETEVYYLYGLDSKEQVREASPEEIALAVKNEQSTGSPTIEVEGSPYIVLNSEQSPIDPEDMPDGDMSEDVEPGSDPGSEP